MLVPKSMAYLFNNKRSKDIEKDAWWERERVRGVR